MIKKVETIINGLTGEVTEREITGEELEALRIEGERIRNEQIAAQEAHNLAKQALLSKLNLSEEEAKLLLS